MNVRTASLLLAVALGAGCSSSSSVIGARLSTPSAVAVFQGVTAKRVGLAPYVAVANAGSEQLTVFDPQDNKTVPSPGLVFPLAVPTAGRPISIAAVTLADGGADALAAVTGPDPETNAVVLQLVNTWDGQPRVASTWTLSTTGETVLSVTGAPVPQAVDAVGGVVPAVSGVARFVISLAGGRLAVVTATRQADGSIALADGGELALGGTTPFNALSLAPSPDGHHLYAASLDPITGTDGSSTVGVAEIDAAGDDPSAWMVRGLSARAPTTGVAAARVIERTLSLSDEFNRDQFDNRRLLVYAIIDPSSCGSQFAIDCGIATLDPDMGGLAEDPVGEMPYRAPMPIPAVPITIATWYTAPAVGSASDVIATASPIVSAPGLRFTPGTGRRSTSALAVVGATNGLTYTLDLGRWGPGSNNSLLRSPTETRVESMSFVTDPDLSDPQIGFWDDDSESDTYGDLDTDASTAIEHFLLTPGYTPDETWLLGWQMPLPNLATRRATLFKDASLGLVLAFEAPDVMGGTTAWREVAGVYAPMFGIHVNDIVELNLDGGDDGSVGGLLDQGEARVAAIIAPDEARWPGGALVLSPPVDPADTADATSGAMENRTGVYQHWVSDLPAGTYTTGFGTIYSSEWLLTGSTFGYAGRPVPDITFSVDYPSPSGGSYPEDALAAACPIPTWPMSGTVPACDDDACRTTCEELAIVRKSRRFYYVQDDCENVSGTDYVSCSVTGRPSQFDVLEPGPVIEFRFGVNAAMVTADHPIARAAHVQFYTFSGLQQSYRAPTYGGQPTGAVGFDRSPYTNDAEPRVVFYESYTGNVLYQLAPGAFATESKTLD